MVLVRTKYRFLDVYSDKNSLAIIYICFKMHFLKYVGIIILFYSMLFIWARCGYQMFLSAPSPCLSDHSSPFSLARLRPLPHTRSREVPEVQRRAAHVCMVRLAISGGSPPPLIRFSLKSSPFLLYLQ